MTAPRGKSAASRTGGSAPVREVPQLGRFTLFELTSRSCRWPTTEHPTLYCGAARADDRRSYCAHHNAIANPGRGTAAEAKVAREHLAAAGRVGEAS